MASKNLWSKTRPVDNPYAIFKSGGWTWKVLKAYQTPEKENTNPYARWFCSVSSPFCPSGELGDVYVADVYTALPFCKHRDPR